MKVFMNFAKGFINTGKTTRMVLLLFVLNLFFSIILALPMYHSLKDSFGSSVVGDRMAEGFDYLWWQEFRDESQGLERTFSPSILGKGAILNNLERLIQMRFFRLPLAVLIMGFLYIIFHTFLAGGILFTFNQDTLKFKIKRFFDGSGTYFFRFLLLLLISSVILFTLVASLKYGFNLIMDNVQKDSLSEITPFYYNLGFSVIIFILILFFQMVFDYARIKIVLEGRRDVLKTVFQAFGFVFRRPFSTLGLYYLIFLIQVAITIGYVFLKEFIPQSDWLFVLLAFFIQQLFIFLIIWLRCLLYSSQMELYRYLK